MFKDDILTESVQQYPGATRPEGRHGDHRAHDTRTPRDPEVDRRIAQAALDLFGEAGWAGFAMEAVACRAGVGKASLYLRWNSKETLLTDAVTMRMSHVTDADTGTLRGDLTELAVQMLDLYAGPGSRAAMRLGWKPTPSPAWQSTTRA
jgi:AcrR family transcriptional regulator